MIEPISYAARRGFAEDAARRVAHAGVMPIISTFLGVTVRMYYADHAPPHVHVAYQGHEALVALEDGRVIEGSVPRRVAAVVTQWCLDHRVELAQNWSRAQALEPITRIAGADND